MNLSAELAREQRDRLPQGGYEKLQAARVAVAGLGGLGSHVAMELARSGVGCLHLIDFDTVDVSNLNRQLYQIQDIGCFKTDALARSIAAAMSTISCWRRRRSASPPCRRRRWRFTRR